MKLCRRGHLAERDKFGACLECKALMRRRYYAANREKENARRAQRYADNRGAELQRKAAYNVTNRAARTATENKRRGRKLNATPKWFGEFDELVMIEAYELAAAREKATGIEWHVDHMVPLQAKLACGLHCARNVQVIPEKMNNWKQNRLVLTERLQWLGHRMMGGPGRSRALRHPVGAHSHAGSASLTYQKKARR